jgi:hypothetical protein
MKRLSTQSLLARTRSAKVSDLRSIQREIARERKMKRPRVALLSALEAKGAELAAGLPQGERVKAFTTSGILHLGRR